MRLLTFARLCLFALLVGGGFCGGNAFAATISWVGGGSGNWGDATQWSPATVPGTGDTAQFPASTGCQINQNVSVAGINLQSGYASTLNQNGYSITVGSSGWTQAGGTFVGSSTASAIIINGPFSLSGGSFTSTSDILTLGGDVTVSNTPTFNANGGSTVFLAPYNGTQAITPGSANFNNVTISAAYGTVQTVTGTLNVNGALILTASDGSNRLNGGTIAVSGNISMNSANFANYPYGPGSATISAVGSGTQTIAGNAAGIFPNVVVNSTGTVALSGTITAGGNWTWSGGSISAAGSTLLFLAPYNSPQAIAGGTVHYNNVTIESSASSVQTVSNTLFVDGNLTLNSAQYGGGILNGGVVQVAGNVTMAGSGFGTYPYGPGSGTILLAGAGGTQTLAGNAPGIFPNIAIDNSTGTINLSGTINAGGNWTWTSGAISTSPNALLVFLAPYAGSQTIAGGSVHYGDATIEANGPSTQTISGTLFVDGNLTLDSTVYGGSVLNGGTVVAAANVTMANANVGSYPYGPGTATIEVAGNGGTQTIAGNAPGIFPNIVVDAAGTVALTGTIYAGGDFVWDNGAISPGSSTLVFLAVYASSRTITGGTVHYNNVTISANGPSTQTVVGNLFIDGNLILTSSPYGGSVLNGGTAVVLGDVSMNSANVCTYPYGPGNLTIDLAGSGSQTIFGNTAGIFPNVQSDSSGTVSLAGTIYSAGNWTFNSGALSAGSSTLIFASPYSGGPSVTQTITGGSGVYNNVTISGNASSIQSVVGALNVGGNLILTESQYNGCKIDGGTLNAGGDLTINSSGFGGGTTAITLNGSGAQNVTVSAGTVPSGPFTVNKAAGSIATLQTPLNVSASGQTLTISQGVLDLNGLNLMLNTGNGALVVNDTLQLQGTETIQASSVTLKSTTPYSTVVYYSGAGTAVMNNLTSLTKTFGNLTFGASRTHQFLADLTNDIVVNGALASTGTNAHPAILRSSTPGQQWRLKLNGTSALADEVDVQDSNASHGNQVVALNSVDSGNNVNWLFVQAIATITVAPSPVSVNPNAAQQFTATAYDGQGHVVTPAPTFTWTVNGGGTIGTTGLFTAQATPLAGPFTVTASVGAVSGSATVSEINTPPVVTNLQPADGSIINNAEPVISAALSDNLNNIDVNSVVLSIDGQSVNATVTTTSLSYTPASILANGTHVVLLSVSDLAGKSTLQSWSFFVDTVPPVFTFLAPPNGSFTNNSQPQFRAHYSDPGGANASGINVNGVMASLDGQLIVGQLVGDPDPSQGLSFTPALPLTEGSHRFAVVIADNATNVNATATIVTVDLTLPTIFGVAPVDGSLLRTTRPLISASYMDTLSGVNVASVVLTIDGVSATAGLSTSASGVSFNPQSDQAQGAHQVVLQVADNAGNVQTATWSYTVDTVAPVISNLLPATGTFTNNPQPSFSGAFSDSGSGVNPASVQISLDATVVTAQATVTASGFTFQPANVLPDGAHTLVVAIADLAGNSTSAQTIVNVLTVPPDPPVATTITIDQDTAQFFGPTQPNVVGIIASVVGANLDYALIGSWSAQVSRTDPNNNNFTLTVQFVDAAGNVSAPSVFNLAFLPLVQSNPINISTFKALSPNFVDSNGVAYFNETSVNFVCEVSGGTAPLTVTIGDQTATNNAGQFAATLTLTEGQTDITATVTDATGLTQTADILVTVDLTPPVLTIDTLTDGASDTANNPITNLATPPVGFLFLNGLGSSGSMAVRQDSFLPRNVFSASSFGINAEATDALSGVSSSVQVDIRETDATFGDESSPYYNYAAQITNSQITAIMAQPTVASFSFPVTAAPVTGGDQNRVTFQATPLASSLQESIRMQGTLNLYKIYYVTLTAADKCGNASTLSFWAKVDKTAPTKVGSPSTYLTPQGTAMAGFATLDPDVVKAGDSDTPMLVLNTAGGVWLFPEPTVAAQLTLEDIAGNRGNAELDFTIPNPKPVVAQSNGSAAYNMNDPCLLFIAPPSGGVSGMGESFYADGITFDGAVTFDSHNYTVIPPSWENPPRMPVIQYNVTNPLPELTTSTVPAVINFLANGIPLETRPFPPIGPGGTVPGAPAGTNTSTTSGMAAGTLNTSTPGWHGFFASYGSTWDFFAETDSSCSTGGGNGFLGGPTTGTVQETWIGVEDYGTAPIQLDKKYSVYQVVPDTFAANAGQIVHIRGAFDKALGAQVSVSFNANTGAGGQGTILIQPSDPTQTPTSAGMGTIIAEDLQNFTAWQTVEVVLADSPDGATGIFDVTVNGSNLPKMVSVLKTEYVTRDVNGGIIPLTGNISHCVPLPVITAAINSYSLVDGTLTLNVSGTVADEVSDVVAPTYQIQAINARLSDHQPIVSVALTNTAQPDIPWKPYKFSANYAMSVVLHVSSPDMYAVHLDTSANAANNIGTLDILVSVGTVNGQLSVDTIDFAPGSDVGNFFPVMLRVSGTKTQFATISNFSATVFGVQYVMLPVDFDTSDEVVLYAQDTNMNAVVFVPAGGAPQSPLITSSPQLPNQSPNADNVKAIGVSQWKSGVSWVETGEEEPPPPGIPKATVTQAVLSGLYIGGTEAIDKQDPDPTNTLKGAALDAAVTALATKIANVSGIYPDSTPIPIAVETISSMITDKTFQHTYASGQSLQTELILRQAVVDAASDFASAGVQFAITRHDVKCNLTFWNTELGADGKSIHFLFTLNNTTAPQWTNKNGITFDNVPSVQLNIWNAVNDMFTTPTGRAYQTDCSMAVTAIWIRAHLLATIKYKQLDISTAAAKLKLDQLFAGVNVDDNGVVQSSNVVRVSQTVRFTPFYQTNPAGENHGMTSFRWDRSVLLPGDNFFIENANVRQNYIYIGGPTKKVFSHTDGISYFSQFKSLKNLDGLSTERNIPDPTNFLNKMTEPDWKP